MFETRKMVKSKTNQAEMKHQKEMENLMNNRRLRFKDIFPDGWPEDEIEMLVRSSTSPHDAERLKNEGCPPELILKILL